MMVLCWVRTKSGLVNATDVLCGHRLQGHMVRQVILHASMLHGYSMVLVGTGRRDIGLVGSPSPNLRLFRQHSLWALVAGSFGLSDHHWYHPVGFQLSCGHRSPGHRARLVTFRPLCCCGSPTFPVGTGRRGI